jgi:phosphatidylserine decarboxylase
LLRDLAGFLNTLLLRIAPQRTLAAFAYRLARVRTIWLKNMLIRLYVRRYRVDTSEAERPEPDGYSDFNSFFTRALRPGTRPIVTDPDEIAMPVDGIVSACGAIEDNRLIQAKGIDYTLEALLGAGLSRPASSDRLAVGGSCRLSDAFSGGAFATLYLSPRDYHRVHMPLDGTLLDMRYVPGRLFSVNDYSTRHVPGLFTRNERLVTVFETLAGPMAVIMVGAIFVAAIETVWSGELSRERPYGRWQREEVRLARGAEMGRFNVGSTVIVLFGRDRVRWSEELRPGVEARMGGRMGYIKSIGQ